MQTLSSGSCCFSVGVGSVGLYTDVLKGVGLMGSFFFLRFNRYTSEKLKADLCILVAWISVQLCFIATCTSWLLNVCYAPGYCSRLIHDTF